MNSLDLETAQEVALGLQCVVEPGQSPCFPAPRLFMQGNEGIRWVLPRVPSITHFLQTFLNVFYSQAWCQALGTDQIKLLPTSWSALLAEIKGCVTMCAECSNAHGNKLSPGSGKGFLGKGEMWAESPKPFTCNATWARGKPEEGVSPELSGTCREREDTFQNEPISHRVRPSTDWA